MATNNWLGNALAVAQVTTITPASITIGDVFSLSISTKSVSFTATTANVSDVVTGLFNAWKASTAAEFQEVVPANQTTFLQLTAQVAGVPFTVVPTVQHAGGSGSTLTGSTATANTGPNNWDNTANWSNGTIPVNGDDVYFANSSVACLYGISQSSVTLNSLNVYSTYTGQIGLPRTNAKGYAEYRPQYLAISATTLNIGAGGGNGSGRLKINVGSVATTANIQGAGNAAEVGIPAILFQGTNSGNVVNITKGTVGLAFFPGESAILNKLQVGYQTNVTGDATVTGGPGLTLSDLEMSGGQATISTGATTVNMTNGTLTVLGTGGFTTINAEGGTVIYQSTGTIAQLSASNKATVDFSKDMRPRTVSHCDLYGTPTIKDPYKTVTWTAGLNLDYTNLPNLQNMDLGTNIKISVSAVS